MRLFEKSTIKNPTITIRVCLDHIDCEAERNATFTEYKKHLTSALLVDWPEAIIDIQAEEDNTDDSVRVEFPRPDNMDNTAEWRIYVQEMDAQAAAFADMEQTWELVV